MTVEEQAHFYKRVKIGVATVIVAGLGLTAACGGGYTVGQGERAGITRFRAVTEVAGPGLHVKIPLVDSAHFIGVRTEWLEWSKDGDSSMDAYSHDQQPAKLSVKVTLRVKSDAKSVQDLYTI